MRILYAGMKKSDERIQETDKDLIELYKETKLRILEK